MRDPGPAAAAPPLAGHWVSLEPITGANAPDVAALDLVRQQVPAMGGPQHARQRAGRYGPAMAVRDNRSGAVIGTLENDEMAGYPGVAVFIVFVDPARARPGFAMEACGLYLPTLFAHGAEILHLEILSFNRQMTHMLDRRHRPPDVRMRRHAYVGGRYWDLLMYGFDRDDWEAFYGRFRSVLPGGARRIAALGSSRRPEVAR